MGYLIYCVIGPIQPYLAQKLDVEIDTVNLVWTFGFVGFIIGSLAAGFVFRRFCKAKQSKMWFLASTFSINGLIMIGIPFINDFKGGLISEGIFILTLPHKIILNFYTLGPIHKRRLLRGVGRWGPPQKEI